jgi:hypothetical protein
MAEPIGRIEVFALDCTDPRGLACFYEALLGGTIVEHPSGGWAELHTDDAKIGFQRIDGHQPPTWPEGDTPQQAHLDILVDDLDVAEEKAMERGAVKASTQPNPNSFRVFIDPAGHPFCIVRPWTEQVS